MTDRLPPNDVGAEQALLGSLLLAGEDGTVRSQEELFGWLADRIGTHNVFYGANHQTVWRVFREQARLGFPIDSVLLCSKLMQAGELEKVGGAAYIGVLCEVGLPVMVESYWGVVWDRYVQRRTIQLTTEWCAKGFDGPLTAEAMEEFKTSLAELQDDVAKPVPMYTMAEIEPRYKAHVMSLKETALDLGNWLPSTRGRIRGIVPGEVVVLIGDTGVGKTALLQSIAVNCGGLTTLMFEMELPETLLYERFIAMKERLACSEVEANYMAADGEMLGQAFLDTRFPRMLICTECGLSLERLKALIHKAESKLKRKVVLVMIDYVQLMAGKGKRYERTSDSAEGIKVLAKQTGTIIVVASQVHRPADESGDVEIRLHSGKDSGAIENSAGLVLGAWRDPEDATCMHLKVLKNTKSRSGFHIRCNFDGEKMLITERADTLDVPARGR